MELTCRPADLTLTSLTCFALEARVQLHPGQASELRHDEILPGPLLAGRVHSHDIECRDRCFAAHQSRNGGPGVSMTVGSFSRDLHLYDQPQRQLLRFD